MVGTTILSNKRKRGNPPRGFRCFRPAPLRDDEAEAGAREMYGVRQKALWN